MSITIGRWTFEGPYALTESWRLKDQSGVYVILCPTEQNQYRVIDAGESAQVKTRVETHDRKDCWRTQLQGHVVCSGVVYAKLAAAWSLKD
jgi:hypothetical protein